MIRDNFQTRVDKILQRIKQTDNHFVSNISFDSREWESTLRMLQMSRQWTSYHCDVSRKRQEPGHKGRHVLRCVLRFYFRCSEYDCLSMVWFALRGVKFYHWLIFFHLRSRFTFRFNITTFLVSFVMRKS